jgi:gas vesicle protein
MKTGTLVLTIATMILGGLIGTGVGFLIAPRSGRATRSLLRSRGVELQEKVAEDINTAAGQVKNRIEDLSIEARDKVVEIGEQLKQHAQIS